MSGLFVLLFFASLLSLIIGLVKPVLFSRIKITSRKLVVFIFGGAFIFSVIGIAMTGEPLEKTTQQENLPPVESIKSSPAVQNKATIPGEITVVSVVDGDTLKISSGEVVRLIGIDSPETKAPYYVEAKNKLTELTLNKKVRLEKDVSETDRYGRLLRFIYVGDLFINLEMVRQGYAVVYTYPPDVKYSQQFVAAEKEARDSKKGLWPLSASSTTTPTPTTQAPPPSGGSSYSLPPCASSDCDCGHFSTHAYAQWFHDNYDPSDQHKLDRDDDGLVCETLP